MTEENIKIVEYNKDIIQFSEMSCDQTFDVIIEIPKGGRMKYEMDDNHRIVLDRVLPWVCHIRQITDSFRKHWRATATH